MSGFIGTRGPASERFWRRVRKTDSCWLWVGSTNRDGYGRFDSGGKVYKGSHRYSWELSFGEIPNGLLCLHRCDTPACVNPEHLFLGTNQDNTDDKIAKGRFRPASGQSHWRWKRFGPNPNGLGKRRPEAMALKNLRSRAYRKEIASRKAALKLAEIEGSNAAKCAESLS